MAKKAYTLDDSVISIIAKTLQVALLTGTDIVDNLRTIEIQNNGVAAMYHRRWRLGHANFLILEVI